MKAEREMEKKELQRKSDQYLNESTVMADQIKELTNDTEGLLGEIEEREHVVEDLGENTKERKACVVET